jgi:DNA helicase-2/ATP-dependent DNA helicase PcrA
MWQSQVPSRFVDELPETSVDVIEDKTSLGNYGGMMGGYGAGSGLGQGPVSGGYGSPGWQRAQAFYEQQRGSKPAGRSAPPTIEGELVASSSGDAGGFAMGDRIFHDKFGYGRVTEIDGNKLTVDFDKAGQKRVVASFVARA